MSAPLTLLLDAALRACALGMAVALLLKLARLRDARAEILIWTAVLLAALAMPLLRAGPPGWLAVPMPHVGFVHVTSGTDFATASGPVITLLGKGQSVALVSSSAPFFQPRWLLDYGARLLGPLYALAVLIQLARLATGLLLTMRLYRTAMPIAEGWAAGRAIRASAAVAGPISFGRCILLPADYAGWSRNKLLAVLAHEESHVGRGDFFIQLLANLYRAAFWFSPFAWWLQARLCALAEAASDEAAIQCLEDRATYAEILVEVSRCAHGLPIQIAMAKGPDIHWRVERILGESRERRLGLTARLAAVSAILPAALIVAGAHAAVPPARTRLPMFTPLTVNEHVAAAPVQDRVAAAQPVKAAPARRARPIRAVTEPDVTYNPRALLDEPSVAVIPAIVSDARRHKNNNNEHAAFVLVGSIYVSGN